MFLSWLSKVYSSDESASYGRIISTISFFVMLLIHLTVAINPHGIFTTLTYIKQLTDYLFYLVIGGYSVASIKEVVRIIWAKWSGKEPPEETTKEETTETK